MSDEELEAFLSATERLPGDVVDAVDLPDLPSTYETWPRHGGGRARSALAEPVGWAVCSWCRQTRLCVHVHDLLICSRCRVRR